MFSDIQVAVELPDFGISTHPDSPTRQRRYHKTQYRIDCSSWVAVRGCCSYSNHNAVATIDIEYNKRLDRQQPCLEGDFNGGSNNIVQSNKSVWRRW